MTKREKELIEFLLETKKLQKEWGKQLSKIKEFVKQC